MSALVCGSEHRAEAGGRAGLLQSLGERRADRGGVEVIRGGQGLWMVGLMSINKISMRKILRVAFVCRTESGF